MGPKKGLVLAGVAATLLAAGGVSFAGEDMTVAKNDMVKCKGANSCKGKSDCKMPGGSCKGQNSCKGQGMKLEKSAKQCEKAGGTVME